MKIKHPWKLYFKAAVIDTVILAAALYGGYLLYKFLESADKLPSFLT